MTFRFTISLALMLTLSYYGSSDAYAQRAQCAPAGGGGHLGGAAAVFVMALYMLAVPK